MFARRMLGLVGYGPAPDADTVAVAVLRHQLAVLLTAAVLTSFLTDVTESIEFALLFVTPVLLVCTTPSQGCPW
jgi:phosphotransferase system  glucose/maltose/N-acetylglucosamine-specific IIC component